MVWPRAITGLLWLLVWPIPNTKRIVPANNSARWSAWQRCQDFDYTPYYEAGSSHWIHSAVFSLEVSTWIVLWSISNSWLQMREASSKTIWELVLSSTGKIKFMLMLSYQKALSLRHYRDGNYEKLSDLFNRRTKRRYPIPSVELSIHLLDSPGLKFGSFTTWFRYMAKFLDDKGFHFFFRPSQIFVDT